MPKASKMDEEDLIRILRQEDADAASYHDSELAKVQENGLNWYFGRPYGNEKEGRSKVVSRDIADDVNSIMPDLMRCFASPVDLVSIEASKPEDDQPYQMGAGPDGKPILSKKSKVDIQAAYLSHVFFKDNRGKENIFDFAFDGLVQRVGIMQVSWEDPEPKPPQTIEGVSAEQLLRYTDDPEYEILSQDEENGVFTLEVRRTPKMGRVHIEAVPPEEFALTKTARNICDAKYHRRKRPAYLAELKRSYPEKEEDLDGLSAAANWADSIWDDGRKQARYPDDNIDPEPNNQDKGRRQVILHEEYVRVDFDGDGIVELRYVKRVGTVVLENYAVEASDYVLWSPNRVSHRAIGLSIADMLDDIQRIRTEITRSYLDSLASTLSPRTYVNTQAMDQNGIDAVADNELSGVIPVKGDPNAAVLEVTAPDISGPALNALEYFDQRKQEASGNTKHKQGMDPASLNKTATGIELLQAAGRSRIELIATWLGAGLEDVFKRAAQLLAAHQDKPRQVKLFGQWCEVDPRTWSDEVSVSVNVGEAGVSKHQRLGNLSLIAAKQEQVLLQAGASNPLVTLQHYRNTLANMATTMGFLDPSLFFGEVPEDFAPEPQPDPKLVEAQMKNKLETEKAQVAAQLQQQKQAFDQQAQAQKLASERELAAFKVQSEQQLAEIRVAMEERIAVMRMNMEARLEQMRMDMEGEQAERDSQRQAAVGAIAARENAKAKANGSKPAMKKSRPGGSLAK